MGLVQQLGGMTLQEMQSRMSSAELAMWMALSKIESAEHEKRQRETSAARGAEQRAQKQLGRR